MRKKMDSKDIRGKTLKKTIEALLNGNFKYEHPRLLFSKDRIEVTLKAGETCQEEVYLGTEDNERIRGYVTSSNRRVVPGLDQFSGTTVCLKYGIDGVGMRPGDRHEGWLCFTTNIGEYKLPFLIQAEKEEVQSLAGEVPDMNTFVQIAKDDFKEAYRLFTDKSFTNLLKNADEKEMALYKGLSRQPVTFQHVEEFLIGTGRKQPVRIELKADHSSYYDIQETVRESFPVQKNGWGHLRLEVEAKGDFLEVPKYVVTDEDFIGSYYQVEYVIHKDVLPKGRQFGEIVVRSPYQELTYRITASREPKVQLKVDVHEKQQKLSLMRDFLEYSCNRMELKTWSGSSHFLLNQLKESGCDYPEYQMYEAYISHVEGNDEQAEEILGRFQNRQLFKENLELAGVYLYLCNLTGLYKDKDQAVRRLQSFYMQKEDSFLLFWILLQMAPESIGSTSRIVFMMEEQFERGCRSPFLYLEAWKYISRDMTLLHRMSGFWAQVFLLAGRKQMLTEELVMRFAYLTGYEKEFNKSMYQAMAMGYDAFPSDDTLEAICRYIMLGNPREPEYFRWFALAVDRGLRLTRLYEYYVETMDTSYQRELPKPLLMYFTYNNSSLGDDKKAFIYASIVGNKFRQPQTYEDYEEHMEKFAIQKAKEGKMNANYAVLYQEFLSDPKTPGRAELIAEKMFTHRLYCDDPKVRYVIVRHDQLREEESYPCIQGVAYPRIYTEDAVILFQDAKQRRYASTVDYNMKKLFDERELVKKVLEQEVREPGLILHYCENTEIDRSNLQIFQRITETKDFSDEYQRSIRKKLLDYYSANIRGEDLDDYLKQMDYKAYAAVDRTSLLEILIARGLFVQAMAVISEFGYEGLRTESLLKLTSRMLIRCDMAEDEELLALASDIYRHGKYDEVILKYLMDFRFGPVNEMLSVWKSAQGFEMDTYDLDEKLLELLMFTSDYRKEGEKILEDYVKHTGKESVVSAYLTQVAYGVFVKEYPMSPFVRERLELACKEEWPVDFVCSLALFEAFAKEKSLDQEQLEMEKEILQKCVKKGMEFAFFKKLPVSLLSPYQLDDKTFVEYHTDPKAKVTLYYALDAGLGKEARYQTEPLRNLYEGIFAKTFTLFYGETLHYYFKAEIGDKVTQTQERVITMNKVEGTPVSKYQMINQMLSAHRLDKEQEVLSQMKKYFRQEQYVESMFTIKKETQEV